MGFVLEVGSLTPDGIMVTGTSCKTGWLSNRTFATKLAGMPIQGLQRANAWTEVLLHVGWSFAHRSPCYTGATLKYSCPLGSVPVKSGGHCYRRPLIPLFRSADQRDFPKDENLYSRAVDTLP